MKNPAPYVLLLLLLPACSEDAAPDAVFRTYLGHLAHGHIQEAFELLSDESQERLAEGERAWVRGERHPLAPEDPPEALEGADGLSLFRRLASGPGFHGVPPVPSDAADRVLDATVEGNRAVVRIRGDTAAFLARLVREDGRWRVLLR